jgi:methyl-accepting chemotaxis protein
VTQMDRSTQQNASLVQQSAAAAASLNEQARRLVDAVAVFRIGGDSRG